MDSESGQNDSDGVRALISWDAPEYHHTEKTSDWFWAVGIISVSVALTAIILNNILLAILVLLGSFTLSMHAARRPSLIHIGMDDKGILFHNYFHPYASLESFWVEEHGTMPKVLIKSKKIFMPYIVLPVQEVEPEEIRKFLVKYLPEEEHSEPLLQKVMEYLGF